VTMAIGIRVSKVIGPVTAGTLRIWGDSDNPRAVDWIMEERWRGVAVAAPIGVNRHWVIGSMAANTKRGIQDMPKTAGRVVDMQVGSRGSLILMAGQAVHY